MTDTVGHAAFRAAFLQIRRGATSGLAPECRRSAHELMTIDLEALQPPLVFLPPKTDALQLLSRGTPLLGRVPNLLVGPEQQYEYDTADDLGLRYRVFDGPRFRILVPKGHLKRYLTLPTNLPPRVGELAQKWVGDVKDPHQMAEIIEHHLQTEYSYDLDSPSGNADNPLDDFLFVSRRGHCEFYSTAMAIMLRTLGVPTRNVAGFVGGTYNRFGGFYSVRQGDAHSWVEAYFRDRGWEQFDPTPPADAVPLAEVSGILAFARDLVEAASQRWNRNVIGYDLNQQVQMLRSVSRRYSLLGRSGGPLDTASSKRIVELAAGLSLIVAAVVVWYRARKKRPSRPTPPSAQEVARVQAMQLYKSLDDAMAARGVSRPTSTPPLGHARALLTIAHPIAQEAHDLTQIYLRVRFGGYALSPDERSSFSSRVRALRDPAKSKPLSRAA